MKQFELKFYKEWYDALSELSHDDRANAVLALLEYLYDGIIPEDKFIRIVTTLMRNKIDSEKAAFDRKNNPAIPNSMSSTDQPSTSNDITDQPSTQNDTINQPSTTTDTASAEQMTEQNESASSPDRQTQTSETDTSPEPKSGISNTDAEGIDEIMEQHYNPSDQFLLKFCKRNSCDINDIIFQAREIMTQWVSDGSWRPSKLPDRSTESILYDIDKLALANSRSL